MTVRFVLVGPAMKRWSPTIYAAVVLLGIGLISLQAHRRDQRRAKSEADAKDLAFADAKKPKLDGHNAEPAPPTTDEPPVPSTTAAFEPSGDRFNVMPDGSPVPALDAAAPSKVKLGLILFRYKGSQAPPPSDRSQAEALSLAKAAAEQAQSDFDKAVTSGDRGSDANIGWMSRGILEPAVEYAVFSLEKGKVSAPIDTPRGYWIVKRLR